MSGMFKTFAKYTSQLVNTSQNDAIDETANVQDLLDEFENLKADCSIQQDVNRQLLNEKTELESRLDSLLQDLPKYKSAYEKVKEQVKQLNCRVALEM